MIPLFFGAFGKWGVTPTFLARAPHHMLVELWWGGATTRMGFLIESWWGVTPTRRIFLINSW